MKNVCKDCTERYPACWGGCPKYQAARAEFDRKKEEKAKILHDERAITCVQYNARRAYKREKQRKEKQKGL